MLRLWSGDRLLWMGGIAFAVLAFFAVLLEMPVWMIPIIPLGLGLIYLTVEDFKWVYFILFACIPLSVEYYLPNGLGTDLPTEPLMLWLSAVTVLYVAAHPSVLRKRFLLHPLSLLVYAHFGWIALSAVFSEMPVVSWKFFLAKGWYLLAFFFLPAIVLREREQISRLIAFLALPLVLVVTVVFIRHSMLGLEFREINSVVGPFFRNHVNYALVVAIAILFLAYRFRDRQIRGLPVTVLGSVIIFLLLALYFSYTRAAMIGLLLCIPAALIIRFRLMKQSLILILIGIVLGTTWLLHEAEYLKFAPNYERTIAHKEFDELISATYKGQDLSTMERVHRWVAGYHMTVEKPLLGFGAGTFYFFYKGYTLNMFKTYVSDNPKKSGIHNYYLMTLVEQGWPGLLLFLAMVSYALILAERVYHRAQTREKRARVLMASSVLVFILAILIINDMVETDKVGSFFWLSMSLLVLFDIQEKDKTPAPDQGSR